MPTIVAYCYLIKGNNQARSKMVDSAILSYASGLRYNSSDNLLQTNFNTLSAARKSLIRHEIKAIQKSISLAPHRSVGTAARNSINVPSIFTGGTMKIVYPSKLLNNNLEYQLRFTINGRIYKFGGSQAIHVKKDTFDKYTDTFELELDKDVAASLTRDDFRQAKCDFNLYAPNKSALTIYPDLNISVILHFTSQKGLLFDKTSINFH
jgi:hypothetical protein